MKQKEIKKETILKAVEYCTSNDECDDCQLCGKDCLSIFAEYIKENEPAPSANDTSSKKNYYQLNDSTKLEICQEKIIKKLELIEQVLNEQIFEDIEQYQVSIPMLAHIIGDAHGMIKELLLDLELKAGDGNV